MSLVSYVHVLLGKKRRGGGGKGVNLPPPPVPTPMLHIYVFSLIFVIQILVKIHSKSMLGSSYSYVESYYSKKIGHWSVKTRGCVKNSWDRKYVIKHPPFDKAKGLSHGWRTLHVLDKTAHPNNASTAMLATLYPH